MCRGTNTMGECIGYLFVYNLWIVQSYRKDKYKQYIRIVWSATCVKYVNWEENELMLTATDTNLTSFGARQNFHSKIPCIFLWEGFAHAASSVSIFHINQPWVFIYVNAIQPIGKHMYLEAMQDQSSWPSFWYPS